MDRTGSAWTTLALACSLMGGCGDSGGDTGGESADTTSSTSTPTETDATIDPTTSTSTPTGSSEDSTGSSEGSTTETGGCVDPSGELIQEELTLMSDDGKSIAATRWQPATGTCLPAVVLVHQFQLDRTQWDAHASVFVEAGYVTLAIDLRGHGDSDPQDGDILELLQDPDQAPLDVKAGLEHLQSLAEVNVDRIGIVGTSIGANLTIVAMTLGHGVYAAVPLSPRLAAIQALAGNPAELDVTNVFCFAGELDGMGAQAQTCQQLETMASGDTQVQIIEGSSAHGVAIVDGFPEVLPAIIAWLNVL